MPTTYRYVYHLYSTYIQLNQRLLIAQCFARTHFNVFVHLYSEFVICCDCCYLSLTQLIRGFFCIIILNSFSFFFALTAFLPSLPLSLRALFQYSTVHFRLTVQNAHTTYLNLTLNWLEYCTRRPIYYVSESESK